MKGNMKGNMMVLRKKLKIVSSGNAAGLPADRHASSSVSPGRLGMCCV